MNKQRCNHSKIQKEKRNTKRAKKKLTLGNSKITKARIDVLREPDFVQQKHRENGKKNESFVSV